MSIIAKHKKEIIITSLLCLAPIVVGIILWNKLPDMMPTHFGLNNEANGYMKKTVAVFLLPVFIAVCELICVIATAVDPKKANISEKSLIVLIWSMPALSWIDNGLTYTASFGHKVNVGSIIITFTGFMLMALSNYLPKNSRNFTVGLRTRWSLDDEGNWNYSNRIAAICGTVCGFIVAVLGIITFFSANSSPFYILALVTILIGSLVPTAASYLYYRKNGAGKSEE